MRIERTAIEGVVLLHWDVAHDARGGFARTFCRAQLAAAGLPFDVVQANVSTNAESLTLRGLHLQADPHGEPKIVSCIRGRIWDVAVDMRHGSPTYRHWVAHELGEGLDRALHLPAGIAHGFLTLTSDSHIYYLMGAPYVPAAQIGIGWDDPAIGISWPEVPRVISDRDRSFSRLPADEG